MPDKPKKTEKKEKILDELKTKKEVPQVKTAITEQEHIFQCNMTVSVPVIPTTPEQILFHKKRSEEFKNKLETLMKEYKVVQTIALILKKL